MVKTTTIGYAKNVMSDASRSQALPFMLKNTTPIRRLKVTKSMPIPVTFTTRGVDSKK